MSRVNRQAAMQMLAMGVQWQRPLTHHLDKNTLYWQQLPHKRRGKKKRYKK